MKLVNVDKKNYNCYSYSMSWLCHSMSWHGILDIHVGFWSLWKQIREKIVAWNCFKSLHAWHLPVRCMVAGTCSWHLSSLNEKSELFSNTVVLSQIATKTNNLYQFLPVNYILGYQMPQILLIFVTVSLATESKQKWML